MSASEPEPSAVELKGGKIIHGGRTWEQFVHSVTFVATSLALGQSIDNCYGSGEARSALNGEAYVDCLGLVVVGEHDRGMQVVRLGIQAGDDARLAERQPTMQGGPRGRYPSYVQLGYDPYDAFSGIERAST